MLLIQWRHVAPIHDSPFIIHLLSPLDEILVHTQDMTHTHRHVTGSYETQEYRFLSIFCIWPLNGRQGGLDHDFVNGAVGLARHRVYDGVADVLPHQDCQNTCVMWFIDMWDMTHSCMTGWSRRVAYSFVWHGLFIRLSDYLCDVMCIFIGWWNLVCTLDHMYTNGLSDVLPHVGW